MIDTLPVPPQPPPRKPGLGLVGNEANGFATRVLPGSLVIEMEHRSVQKLGRVKIYTKRVLFMEITPDEAVKLAMSLIADAHRAMAFEQEFDRA